MAGPALVAFGAGELPERGPFKLELASGLKLQGFAVGGGEVLNLRGELGGRPVELPAVASSSQRGTCPRWPAARRTRARGTAGSASSTPSPRARARRKAREKKATALHPSLAGALPRGARHARVARLNPERLEQIPAATDFPDDWLLQAEVDELKQSARA